MLELEDYYKQYTGNYFALELYGNGPDRRAIMRAFHGRRNSVNASPKEEAELEAEDGDVDEMEEITLTGNVASNSTDLEPPGEDSYVRFSATKQKLAEFKERTKLKTKRKIAKLKDSINAVELPQTLHELIRRKPIPATFPGRVDHGELTDFKIFLNPSTSEVLCTTTAEALAMGKFGTCGNCNQDRETNDSGCPFLLAESVPFYNSHHSRSILLFHALPASSSHHSCSPVQHFLFTISKLLGVPKQI